MRSVMAKGFFCRALQEWIARYGMQITFQSRWYDVSSFHMNMMAYQVEDGKDFLIGLRDMREEKRDVQIFLSVGLESDPIRQMVKSADNYSLTQLWQKAIEVKE